MKILFEEYQYQTEDVKDVLGSFVLSKLNLQKTTQELNYVGYFYNSEIVNKDGTNGDLVFILPKVLLDAEGKAFGVNPKTLIDFNWKDWKKDEKVLPEGQLSKLDVYNFIYGFTVWIYRAVSIYRRSKRKDKEDNAETEVMTSVEVGKSGKKEDNTYMDILLSLLDFQRTHKSFITFVMKMAHSGFNKISWSRTIAKTTAVFQDEEPLYLNPINKKRVVNFDEELLIIYYSILNYMHEEYGFPIPNQPGYKLIKGAMFKSYLKSQGKTRLHKIRYKYFSDSALLLWNICYAFFDKADSLNSQTGRKDFLLVSSFHGVFEAMIDELVGDTDLPVNLKHNSDDKRIDHLYTYKYLLENMDGQHDVKMDRKVYNIADSKYYRRDKKLTDKDIAKQFTYSRNVIQWHMDLLHDLLGKEVKNVDEYREIQLFDDITEGYNIIPNFFISAAVDDGLSYDKDGFGITQLNDGKKDVPESFHFWERLFHPLSAFTLHFDVNFLYVLKLYAHNKSYDKSVWKYKVREEFRREILEYLNKEFLFYQIIIPEDQIKEFVDRYFRALTGKVFSFIYNGSRILVYAERSSQETKKDKTFDIDEKITSRIVDETLSIPSRNGDVRVPVRGVKLGKNGYEFVNRMVCYPGKAYKIEIDSLGRNVLNPIEIITELPIIHNPNEEYALVGYYKSEAHLQWIINNGKYNRRAQMRNDNVKMTLAEIRAKYLILHNERLGNKVYQITSVAPYLMPKDALPMGEGYQPNRDFYMIYDVDTKEESNAIPTQFFDTAKFKEFSQQFKPIGIKMSELRMLTRIVPLHTLQSYIDEHEDVFTRIVAEDEPAYGQADF